MNTKSIIGLIFIIIQIITGLVCINVSLNFNKIIKDTMDKNVSTAPGPCQSPPTTLSPTSTQPDTKFCNANTPTTWLYNQKLAKMFYPKDFQDYEYHDQPMAFFTKFSTSDDKQLYKERERQVESAQLLGQTQGLSNGLLGIGGVLVFLGFVELFFLIPSYSNKDKSKKN